MCRQRGAMPYNNSLGLTLARPVMNIRNMSATEFAKYKLIMAAIKLFGQKGVDAVSLREINREAGAKNNAALHYHFGTKYGLIEAVVHYIQAAFDEEREPVLSNLESRAKTHPITVEEIMKAHVDPYIDIIQGYDWGLHAIRAIARMEFDGDSDLHTLLSESAGVAIKREFTLLRLALPDLPIKELKQRYNFLVNSIITGFADCQNLHQSYLGNLTLKNLEGLAELYIKLSTSALSAPQNA